MEASDGAADIVDVLLDQHVQITGMLARVNAESGATKADAFVRLTSFLEAHERGEREVVHPAVRESLGAEAVAAARLAEEQQAATTLAELKRLGVDDATFGPKFAEFAGAVRAHGAREEKEEFPRLRESLDPAARAALAHRLRAVQGL